MLDAQATAAPEAEPEARPQLDLTQLKAIVEALIFASPEPLTPKTLFRLLADEPREDVQAALAAVQADYEARPGLQVAEVAGGYQVTTRPELHDWVRRLFHERTTQKLSVAALETLSVIAYKQPITQAEIGEIRGVKRRASSPRSSSGISSRSSAARTSSGGPFSTARRASSSSASA